MNWRIEEIRDIINDCVENEAFGDFLHNETGNGRKIEKIFYLLGKCVTRNEENLEDKIEACDLENDRSKRYIKDLKEDNKALKSKITSLEEKNEKHH